jgi:hypothetical protein
MLICLDVFGHDTLQLFLQLIALVFEFLERAAPLFGDISREFDAVQAEVRATEQAEFVADQQDIAEDGPDFFLHGRDKGSNRAVVGGVTVGKGNEEDVLVAGALYLAKTDHAFGIRQENNLEQDFGVNGSSPNLVVVVASVEDGQVKSLFDQFADGVFKRAGENLVLEGNGQHDHLLVVARFVFCHGVLLV